MRLISVKNEYHDVRFVCDARNTRNGFAHDATLFIDGCEVASATCHYLNRTWERWRFESVCLSCVSKALDDRKARLKEDYKAAHGLSRIAGKAKDDLAFMIGNDLRVATLNDVRDELNRGMY